MGKSQGLGSNLRSYPICASVSLSVKHDYGIRLTGLLCELM